MNIQIFGKAKCFDTKKAERYFKERRIKYQFVDILRFGMSRGELNSVKNAVGLEAMVDSEVLMIPVTVVEPMLQGSLELLRMYNRYLVSALEYHWETKMLLYRCTAMERYRWFLSRYPGLIDSISNKHIASFLGMTPVTLSRLRRQLRSQADGGEEAPGEAAKTE